MKSLLLTLGLLLTCVTFAQEPVPVSCPAMPAGSPPAYDRSLYRHWSDADGDCQNTRAEVLLRDTDQPVEFTAATAVRRCVVESGHWRDWYSGDERVVASAVEIDHVVPLADAHASGGWQWTIAQRQQFANDPHNLVVTTRRTNRTKWAHAPDAWLPTSAEAKCRFVTRWYETKAQYGLRMRPEEARAIFRVLRTCPDSVAVDTFDPTPGW